MLIVAGVLLGFVNTREIFFLLFYVILRFALLGPHVGRDRECKWIFIFLLFFYMYPFVYV